MALLNRKSLNTKFSSAAQDRFGNKNTDSSTINGTSSSTSTSAVGNSTNSSLSVVTFVRDPGSVGMSKCLTPQLQYEGDRHLIPERLPSARRDRAVSMKLTFLTDDNLPHLLLMSSRLRRLDLTGVGLIQLPAGLIDNLRQLEHLIVDENDLTVDSFPKNFSKLDQLIVLSARRNKINALCDPLQCLRSLRRLNLEYNELNQIKGIEYLTQLKSLLLDGNNLTNFPPGLYSLRHLEVLYACENRLSSLSSQIKNLTFLQELKLSGNRLKSLPAVVFNLPRLQSLTANRNEIDNIPTLLLKGGSTGGGGGGGGARRMIDDVDLSENQLSLFPASLPLVCRHLDLSYNCITSVPDTVLRRLSWPCNDRTWDLHANPIIQPPIEVCEGGLASLMQHYHETRVNSPSYQGIKFLFVGAEGSGKTSLIQTLLDTRTRLTDAIDSHTLSCDYYFTSWDIPLPCSSSVKKEEENSSQKEQNGEEQEEEEEEANKQTINEKEEEIPKGRVDLCFIDYSSERIYECFLPLFARKPLLMLLCVDVNTYCEEAFGKFIGHYLDMMINQDNFIFCIILLTKVDLCNNSQLLAKQTAAIYNQVEIYLQQQIKNIEYEINKIESQAIITMAMTEQLKLFLKLKSLKIHLHSKAIGCSVKILDSIKHLQTTLSHCLSEDAVTLFDRVLKPIPPLWRDVEDAIEDESFQRPMKSLQNYFTMVQDRFGLKPVGKKICLYLEEIGKILWLHRDNNNGNNSTNNKQEDSDVLILSPNTLALCLRRLFRTNFKEYIEDQNDRDEVFFRFMERNNNNMVKWNFVVNQACLHGVMTSALLRALWGDLLIEAHHCDLIDYICTHLQFGFPLSEKRRIIDPHRHSIDSNLSDLSTENNKEYEFPYELNPLPQIITLREISATRTLNKKQKVNKQHGSVKFTLNENTASKEQINEENNLQVEPPMRTKDRQLFEDGVVPPVFIPMLCPYEQCPSQLYNEKWSTWIDKPMKHKVIVTSFILKEVPVYGLFHRIMTTLHDYESFKFRFLSVWRNGICLTSMESTWEMKIEEVTLRDSRQAIRTFIVPTNNASKDTKVDNSQDDNIMSILWSSLLTVLRAIEQMLLQFEGLSFLRRVDCPHCKETTFIGEWTTPKDLQAIKSVFCRLCSASVPTAFLVQPKEKRNNEQINKIKEEMRARRERQESIAPSVNLPPASTSSALSTASTPLPDSQSTISHRRLKSGRSKGSKT